MNAELYILRNMNNSGKSKAELNMVADALKSRGITVAYKTELDVDEDKIIECVAQSLKPDENIDYIVIPNGFEMKAENTVIYKTLSFITSDNINSVKRRFLEKTGELTGSFHRGRAVNGNGFKYGYFFIINGVKVILLPVVEKSGIKFLIGNALDDAGSVAVKKGSADSNTEPEQKKNDTEDYDIDKILSAVDQEIEKISDNNNKYDTNNIPEYGDEPVVKPVGEFVAEPDEQLPVKMEEPAVKDTADTIDISNEPAVEDTADTIDISNEPVSLNVNDVDEFVSFKGENTAYEIGGSSKKDKKKKKEKKKSSKNKNDNNEDVTAVDNSDDEHAINISSSKKENVGFFKERFVPLKTDSGKEKVRKVILDLAIIVFIVTAIILIKLMVIDPFLNNQKYDEIRKRVDGGQEIATEITTDAEGNKIVKKIKSSKNWDELKSINKEVIGWVTIDGTNIDYPVLQHKGDTIDYQYYLYKDIYQEYSGYGSIFADFRSNKGVDSKNIILHGHHMNDGSMFQNLMGYGKYEADMDFYKEHPVIEFDSPSGDATYKIISVFKTSTLDAHGEFFDYLTGSFASDAEFMNYVYLVRERSLIDTGVTCNEDDQLLTLSTCSYEYSDFRTVVVARKTRTGESSKVDVSKAKANPDPLWPDVYYGYDDSAKPNVTTFKTASKKGLTDWYDGKGNLKGKERMFTLHDGEEESTEPTEPTEATEAPAPTDPPVYENESILFDYNTLVMNVGDIETLKIYWTPENTTDKSIKWTSSNANVATIASGGVVTAKAPGECTITAETYNNHTTECKIVVNDITATKLTMSPSDYTTNGIGETFKLTATVEPSNHSHDIVWSTSDSNVATVSSAGKVKIVGYGKCTISASIDGLTVSCNVTVNRQ